MNNPFDFKKDFELFTNKFEGIEETLENKLKAYIDRRIAEAFRKFAKGMDALADETENSKDPS